MGLPLFDGSDVTIDTISAMMVNTDSAHNRHSIVIPENIQVIDIYKVVLINGQKAFCFYLC